MHGNFKPSPQNSTAWRRWRLAHTLLGVGLGLILPTVALGQTPKAASPAKPPAAAGATVYQRSAKPFLKVGSQGTEVAELQAMLQLMGYYTGAINGTYSEGTAAAVAKFQKAANLAADGVVGADTWNRLLPAAPTIAATTSATASTTAARPEFPPPTAAKPGNTAAPTTKSAPPRSTAATTTTETTQTGVPDSALLPILRLGMKGPAVEGLQGRLKALGYLKGAIDGVFGAETQSAVKAAQRQFNLESDGIVGQATWSGLLR